MDARVPDRAGLVAQALSSPGEAFLNALYDGIVEGVLAVSLQTHHIIYWNKGAETYFGYPAEEVMDQSAAFLYPDEDSFQRMQATCEPALRDCGSWFGEWQFKRRDESTFSAEVTFSVFLKDEQGNNAYAVMVIRDVTERQEARAAIDRRNALLLLHHRVAAAAGETFDWTEALTAAMQHFCTYGYWCVGHAVLYETTLNPLYSGHVWHFANDSAKKYERFKRVSNDVRMDARKGFMGRVLTERRPQWITDISPTDMLRRRSEEARVAGLRSAFAFPVLLGDRVVAALELFGEESLEPDEPLIEVAENLGIQLGRIFERQETEIRLRENERMAAVGLTASKIAHEIANPLNGMYTTAQLLYRQCQQQLGEPLDEETCDTVGTLVHETDRLRELLEELRSLSFRGPTKLEVRNPADLINTLLKSQEPIFRDAGIRLRTQFAPNVADVRVEPARFSQALLNLVKNAVEAMPDGGQLTLRLGQPQDDVVIEISDTGMGIPEGLPIFELFATSKASGSGLGLPVVQQVVAAHNGRIDYWSVPNEGTTFRLTLPAAN